jgi:hypothetical protein
MYLVGKLHSNVTMSMPEPLSWTSGSHDEADGRRVHVSRHFGNSSFVMGTLLVHVEVQPLVRCAVNQSSRFFVASMAYLEILAIRYRTPKRILLLYVEKESRDVKLKVKNIIVWKRGKTQTGGKGA